VLSGEAPNTNNTVFDLHERANNYNTEIHNEKFNYIKFWCDLNVIIRIEYILLKFHWGVKAWTEAHCVSYKNVRKLLRHWLFTSDVVMEARARSDLSFIGMWNISFIIMWPLHNQSYCNISMKNRSNVIISIILYKVHYLDFWIELEKNWVRIVLNL
jgi:hypothetical protein